MPPDDLDALMYLGINNLARTGDPTLARHLREVFPIYAEKVQSEQRNQTCLAINRHVVDQEAGVMGSMVFMLCDPDIVIVAQATMTAALANPINEGDELTGPKSIIDIMLTPSQDRAGMFSGLLLLGDRRVAELLNEIRIVLSPKDVDRIGRVQPNPLYVGIVEFWLGWLEEIVEIPEEEDLLGQLAGILLNLATLLDPTDSILDVERVFFPNLGQTSVKVVKEWPAQEYAETVRERLVIAALVEPEPRILPMVAEAWQLLPV
jgi:hypothetical protein